MGKKVLIIHASPRGAQSKSRMLAHHFETAWAQKFGVDSITHHDTCTLNLPHLLDGLYDDLSLPHDKVPTLTPDRKQAWHRSQGLIDDILSADVVAVFSPFWNFGMPSHLKAWVDNVTLMYRMFQYDANHPLTGPMSKQQGFIVSTMGGAHDDNDPKGDWNHLTPHMKTVFEFWGIKRHNMHHMNVTRLDVSEDIAKTNIANAKQAILEYINNQ